MNQTLDQTKEKINHKVAHDIMSEFDFVKVLNYMKSIGWQYRGQEPTLEDIKDAARMCLRNCVNDFEKTNVPYGNCGTGGFSATYFPWGLSLTFNLEYKRNY